jgi:hypothetical protein
MKANLLTCNHRLIIELNYIEHSVAAHQTENPGMRLMRTGPVIAVDKHNFGAVFGMTGRVFSALKTNDVLFKSRSPWNTADTVSRFSY